MRDNFFFHIGGESVSLKSGYEQRIYKPMDKEQTTSKGERRRGNANNMDIGFPFGVLVAPSRPTSIFGIRSVSFVRAVLFVNVC